MAMRIERLRVWLLVSAALLVVVIAGFIGSARYLRRHLLSKLPSKLGANVEIDTSGITWSHTSGPVTDFVIHAAKDVKRKDGKVELHDVWMKMCGRQQRRADMVRGDDWEWDQKAGVVRAQGLVHIELRDTSGKPDCTAADDATSSDSSNALRVTTRDLIYMQQLGVAATSAPIEFDSGTMHGHAVGADYASDTGTLMLHSAVSIAGVSAGQQVELNAASAEMDGQERVMRLANARYTAGSGMAARTAEAEHAVLHLRANQTLERIEAQGDVKMKAGGGAVSSANADVTMNEAGHPVKALLTGGVRYEATGLLAERRGEAQEAEIAFDGRSSPQAQHAVFTGAAHLAERSRTDTKAAWQTRELSAAKVEVALAMAAAGKNEVRDAEASGGAKFTEVTAVTGAGAGVVSGKSGTTEISADDLKAHFAAGTDAATNAQAQLETIAGRGHTLVHQIDAKGVEQTSAGDTLVARLRPANSNAVKGKVTNGAARAGFADSDELASAVQTGHVFVTRRNPAKGAQGGSAGEQHADVQEARAEQATYDGASDRMVLHGGVQLKEPDGQLWASEVTLDHATGNALAAGEVRAEYAPTAKNATRGTEQEPSHILAQRAELDHAKSTAVFYGSPVRIWQGGSQIQAPVVEIDRSTKQMTARGENAPGAMQADAVRTVLMSDRTGQPAGAPGARRATACAANGGAEKSTETQQQAIRIASGGLVYSGILGQAEFTGGFRAETAGATIRATSGTVYLKDTKGAKDAGAAQAVPLGVPSLEGNVDHVVASGQVVIDRPGLRATGERLLYAAAEQIFLLTGDAKNPATARDERGSMTTGAALRFRPGCGATGDTVEVLSTVPGIPGSPSGQVHTESRLDTKREKAR
jgi:lipopolysaccharide export system protein LptA